MCYSLKFAAALQIVGFVNTVHLAGVGSYQYIISQGMLGTCNQQGGQAPDFILIPVMIGLVGPFNFNSQVFCLFLCKGS
jgi:hypothetical protein